ncbi:MAG: four helix bundle protein [Candidatus Bipolaricaulota bacterium]
MYYRDLNVWKEAHELTLKIYKMTDDFPQRERARLADELCRSSSAVPAAIAEGQSRATTEEYVNNLHDARGMLEKTRYNLLLGKDLGHVDEESYRKLSDSCARVSKMLAGLIKSLSAKTATHT